MRPASAVVLCLAVIAGCGDGVRHNWPPSYHHDTMHLGIVKREAGARAAALTGAGRAAGLGAESAIANPAALAGISKPALSAGAGYILSDLTVRPSREDAQAQSFFGSWSPAYLAAATPVASGRWVIGASLWEPYDYRYQMEGGVTGRGGLYAVGPAVAVTVRGFRLGLAGDYLFGNLKLTSEPRCPAYDGVGLTGGGGRAAVARAFPLGRGWSLGTAVVGYYGGRVGAGGGTAYNVRLPDAAAVAFSLRARSVTVHGDYVYQFTRSMMAEDRYTDDIIRAFGKDVGWASAGAEYVTAGGAVARGGASYRPWYVGDAARRAVHGWYYGIGGGWLTAGGRGRMDAALEYGRRGSRDDAGYVVGDIAFIVSYNHRW